MNSQLKIGLYIACVIGAAVFGVLFFRALGDKEPASPATPPSASAGGGLETNAGLERGPELDENLGSNHASLALTNEPAAAPGASDPQTVTSARTPSGRAGRVMKYGGLLFIFVIGLALLLAHDISHFVGQRAEGFILSDDGEALRDPEYEEAERLWADGQHLGAIQLMREHLKKFPRQQYVALRIAEIYEKDLGNPLAAALEYEEVLNHKLEPERWGWAAIHLANLYSGKLHKAEQAETWLRRIVDDYGHTSAARKARERLGLPEPVEEAPVAPETPDSGSGRASDSNLPPGFRPK